MYSDHVLVNLEYCAFRCYYKRGSPSAATVSPRKKCTRESIFDDIFSRFGKMFTSVPDLCSYLLSCCEHEKSVVAVVTSDGEPWVVFIYR